MYGDIELFYDDGGNVVAVHFPGPIDMYGAPMYDTTGLDTWSCLIDTTIHGSIA